LTPEALIDEETHVSSLLCCAANAIRAQKQKNTANTQSNQHLEAKARRESPEDLQRSALSQHD
jgi:hypothetical protein